MTKEDLRLESANFFLCHNEDCGVEKQLELLDKAVEEDTTLSDEVTIWEPFQHYPPEDILEQIERLTDILGKIYSLASNLKKEENG
jgi:hypothetical protein